MHVKITNILHIDSGRFPELNQKSWLAPLRCAFSRKKEKRLPRSIQTVKNLGLGPPRPLIWEETDICVINDHFLLSIP
jgi:hypothetical protein